MQNDRCIALIIVLRSKSAEVQNLAETGRSNMMPHFAFLVIHELIHLNFY